MRSLVFDSQDLGRTEEFLNQAYTTMHIGSRGQVRTEITRDLLASVSVDQIDIGFDMSYDADPLGKICLCVVESGTIEDHATDGWEDAFGPGDVVSFAPPDRPFKGTVCRSRYSIVMFDPALLTRVAAANPALKPGPVRLTGHRPVSRAAGAQLAHTIDYLRDHVLEAPEETWPGTPDLVASTASQLLAASVLNAFANTSSTEPTSADRRDAHPQTLRRAIEFVESNAHRDISVTDVADASGVSVRAVQLAFRRYLGTTPMGYLRRIRLSEAHRTLQEADPESSTVTGVAARWGFYHAGRFAAEYRAAYGQSPGTTLKA